MHNKDLVCIIIELDSINKIAGHMDCFQNPDSWESRMVSGFKPFYLLIHIGTHGESGCDKKSELKKTGAEPHHLNLCPKLGELRNPV